VTCSKTQPRSTSTGTELDLLAQAAEHDWSKVDPTIFGSLMEGVIGRERRWELGAHYTHEADILKIIGPTIVRPWQRRIDTVTTPAAARELLDELTSFVVLDPACGCGNFLYIAYRELRSLEHQLKQRITDLAASTGQPLPPKPWPYVPLTNLCGIDIEPVAVLIARITLWMGHRQMIDRYGEAENPLPLISLAGITIADAVFTPWPTSDCVVGNPPFLGDRLIRHAHGGDYVEKLKKTFEVGVVDYSAYWFRRAEAHLAAGQRGGLVSTNTLARKQAPARVAGLHRAERGSHHRRRLLPEVAGRSQGARVHHQLDPAAHHTGHHVHPRRAHGQRHHPPTQGRGSPVLTRRCCPRTRAALSSAASPPAQDSL